MRTRDLYRKLRRRNNQKGFTLIELLVVISILGILAAIVTMSMVGITTLATQRAAQAELQSVQTAYDAMLANQGVDPTKACPGADSPANGDMNAWPAAATTTPHALQPLAPDYLRGNSGGAGIVHGVYHCTGNGQISQTSYTP